MMRCRQGARSILLLPVLLLAFQNPASGAPWPEAAESPEATPDPAITPEISIETDAAFSLLPILTEQAAPADEELVSLQQDAVRLKKIGADSARFLNAIESKEIPNLATLVSLSGHFEDLGKEMDGPEGGSGQLKNVFYTYLLGSMGLQGGSDKQTFLDEMKHNLDIVRTVRGKLVLKIADGPNISPELAEALIPKLEYDAEAIAKAIEALAQDLLKQGY